MAGARCDRLLCHVLRVDAMGSMERQISSLSLSGDNGFCCAGAGTFLVGDRDPGDDVCAAISLGSSGGDERYASVDFAAWVCGYFGNDAAGTDVLPR